MIKIIVTISDYGAAANVGGDVERNSYEILIPTNNIPNALKEYLENEETRKWQGISFSLLKDTP